MLHLGAGGPGGIPGLIRPGATAANHTPILLRVTLQEVLGVELSLQKASVRWTVVDGARSASTRATVRWAFQRSWANPPKSYQTRRALTTSA